FHAAISDRKYEFLSRELKDLFASPVDLVHYSAIITELKESPGNPQAMEHCERVVMQELIQIFKKYVF
ncbi:MAG TPA: hypothetical protein VIN08_20795, partial [Ohtaekwangia sp.]|uniref:hypothetical protein n=1 Tax=Ohtaekwangia sp. TaxID=2066019 RepID=UPI002F94C858